MSTFVIRSCRIVDPPIPLEMGEVIAKYAVAAGPVLMIGVSLIYSADTGELQAQLPRGKHGYNTRIPDKRDREELMAALLAAYRLMGGVIADSAACDGSHIASDAA